MKSSAESDSSCWVASNLWPIKRCWKKMCLNTQLSMMLSFSLHYHTSHVHVYDFSSFATWKCLTNYNVMPNIWHQFGRTGRKKFRCSHNYIATRSRSTFQGKNFSLIVMLKIKGPSEKKNKKFYSRIGTVVVAPAPLPFIRAWAKRNIMEKWKVNFIYERN